MSKGVMHETAAASMVRALSLLLAMLSWACVVVERPGQTTLQVPVRASHLPAGLKVASALPERVTVTVRGPRILLWLLPYREISCNLDLAGTSPGSTSYAVQEDAVLLPDRELTVERIGPNSIPLTLAGNS